MQITNRDGNVCYSNAKQSDSVQIVLNCSAAY